jgi:hypothetical protein
MIKYRYVGGGGGGGGGGVVGSEIRPQLLAEDEPEDNILPNHWEEDQPVPVSHLRSPTN